MPAVPAVDNTAEKREYPKPTGKFGGDADVISKLFTLAYDLSERKVKLLAEMADNRTALRSLRAVMEPEQVAEVNALYHERESQKGK